LNFAIAGRLLNANRFVEESGKRDRGEKRERKGRSDWSRVGTAKPHLEVRMGRDESGASEDLVTGLSGVA